MENPVVEQAYMQELDAQAAVSKNGPALAMALLLVVAVTMGSIGHFISVPRLAWMQLGGLLVLGVLYTAISYRASSALPERPVFRNTVFISVALFAALVTIGFVRGGVQWVHTVSLAAAFLLPATVTESWMVFKTLGGRGKAVWQFTPDIPAEPLFVYLENRPVRLHVSLEDGRKADLTATVPASLNLGLAFYYLMKARDPIGDARFTFVNDHNQPYAWRFYTRGVFGKQYLNPHDTVLNNQIKPRTAIVAERLGALPHAINA